MGGFKLSSKRTKHQGAHRSFAGCFCRFFSPMDFGRHARKSEAAHFTKVARRRSGSGKEPKPIKTTTDMKKINYTALVAAIIAAGVLLTTLGGCSTATTLPTGLDRPGGNEQPGGGSSDITWPPTGR